MAEKKKQRRKRQQLKVQSFAPIGPNGEMVLLAETYEDGTSKWFISEEMRKKVWIPHAQELLDKAAESLSKF